MTVPLLYCWRGVRLLRLLKCQAVYHSNIAHVRGPVFDLEAQVLGLEPSVLVDITE